ncbi:small integral membrane protein 4 [Pristis pectinata]|uniref:small integral membrane protein 4 n=1 Tax=Pristis pectinata TaxID=685728 RepID=UPI00223E0317|nr:small integral membrane protein 4 [Pristis pectinata]
MLQSSRFKRWLGLVPGKKLFGAYRFLPCFFVLGGVLEWIMINVRIGHETFYDVYRRKRSERQYQQKLEELSTSENQLPSK